MKALLTDLDRTLTGPDLRLDPRVPRAVRELRRASVEVVVVTGRPLEHVLATPLADAAGAIVAENGAVLHHARRTSLADELHARFRDDACRALGDLHASFAWGRVMGSGLRTVATRARRLLDEAGVACELSFNAEEVMLLPRGVHKGSGALRVLRALGIDAAQAVAVGDGDNDAELFASVGRSYAVANASPRARQAATHVLSRSYADGFLELADLLLAERARIRTTA